MGRLSTLTVILIIGAWGAATESASSDDAVSSPATAARKPAPVPPIRYLEAGSRLFNSGNFELAAKYLAAAQMYRDQLQQDEQTMLDAYLRELSKVRASTAAGSTATDGAGPAKTAASPAMTPAAVQADPAKTAASPAMTPAAVQADPAKTAASPAMTPAAVQADPAKTAASPAMTPAAVQAAPAKTLAQAPRQPGDDPCRRAGSPGDDPCRRAGSPGDDPCRRAGSPAMTPASPAMTPAAVQAAPATTSVIQSGDPARGGAGDVAITPDVKQHAVWLLHEAREQMAQGNFDAAEKKIAEAEAIDIKWGLFDDTPTKVRTDLNKERPKNLASTSKPAQSLPHNRENAHALLREARAALANHQIDQAEAIAQEVKSWNLSYSFFGDNPDKVAAAARALRKRDKIRNTPTRERASQGVYDVLVQESRQLMKLGKLNEAEAKALQAQRMNVVPALTADRAESVLHDIAMARVRSGSGSPAATPAAEPPSLVAEHEANDLLDKGDQAKAAAKFVESEELRDKESGRAAIGQALATAAPAVDMSIQKSPGAEPATEPLPAAPGAAGSPTPDKPAAPALDSQPKPEPPGQGDALAAPGAAGSPTPDKPAAPALDSQPKPEPPAQGDALAAPGAAGSPTPDKPAAPALDSQPKPEPPGQGDALAAPGAAGSPTPDKPAAPALDSQPKPEPPGQGDALAAPGAAGSPTPDKPAAPAPDSTSKPAQSLPHNRENARAMLREARAALANHQIDQAEAIAQEVKSWNLSYGFFGENPDKVAAAARALRKRDKIRNTPTRERASQGVYDVLVQESRQLMKLGKLNEAEAKALQAQRMNVVPALTADRAESVLHDIAMARVRSGSGSPAATPAAEPPSLVAEHEANDLLDKGDQAKAAAKFAESEKLRDKESGRAAIGQAPATAAPAVDASIQKSSGALPATEPLPAAPGAAGSPTPDTPAAPAPDSQPKPEPPGQGDALAAPGAAGSPTPDTPAAPAPDSQPKPEPPGQGDAPVALAPADQPKNPPGQPDQAEPAKADAPVALAPADQPKNPPGQPDQAKPAKADAPVALAPADQPKPAKADAPVALAPADQPNDQPPAPPEAPQSPAGKGQQMLALARALYTSGNYPAARQMAEDAKAGQLGVDGQADELLAQIGLAEQGGALSLYESALAAMRSGENARARALLTEVAAAGASLDENLLTKVQELLKKLSADDKAGSPKGKAVVDEKSSVIPDAEALAAQKLNAEVGTKIAEARRLQETDPDKAIAIYEQTMKAVKSSGLSPNLMRPMLRRLEVALELAKKDKTAFEVKMQNKQERGEIELKRLRILEADKAKKARLKEFMDKAQGGLCRGQLRRMRGLRQESRRGRPQRGGRNHACLQGQDGAPLQARPGNPRGQGRGSADSLPGG